MFWEIVLAILFCIYVAPWLIAIVFCVLGAIWMFVAEASANLAKGFVWLIVQPFKWVYIARRLKWFS